MRSRPHRLLGFFAVVVCSAVLSNAAVAAYGLALGATPKYGPGFTHFDYVNPNAPKGGDVVMSSIGTFDKLNPFTLKGAAADGLSGDLVFETLAVQSLDEPFSMYGLLASDMELAPDKLSITFHLNPKARFSNGDPVTAQDVKYSFDTLMSSAASPIYRSLFADVKRAVVVDPDTVRFDFKRRNRELHMIIGVGLPIFSPRWGAGKPFQDVVLDRPIGSGPYVVEKYDLGKNITYRRDPHYWGADLPSRRGMFNFNRITFQYYRDELVRLEAFKAGDFDFIHENVSKIWARSYTGPKFDDGEIVKRELTHHNPQGMQGFVFNLRRPLFQDIRVREALTLAMDFEWMNRELFYSQYKRSYSYFTNSEMAARGTPSAAELKLLDPVRQYIEPAAFGPVQPPPSTKPPHSLRKNLLAARALLRQAGWHYRDGALRNKDGEPFVFDIMLDTRSFERVAAPFARNLAILGIKANFRVVDPALFVKRVQDFDYDMIVNWYQSSESPGNELFLEFSSATADEKGSFNYMGLKNRGIDQLVQDVLDAETRRGLVIACRALDRALLAGHYIIPQWYNTVHRVAYWNRFGIPKTQPLYYQPGDWFLHAWWIKGKGH